MLLSAVTIAWRLLVSLLTAEPIDTQEALRMGLIDGIAPPDRLLDMALLDFSQQQPR